jgi:predicted PurR-regulated permease PerM
LFFISKFGIAGALVAQLLANAVLYIFKEYEARKLTALKPDE